MWDIYKHIRSLKSKVVPIDRRTKYKVVGREVEVLTRPTRTVSANTLVRVSVFLFRLSEIKYKVGSSSEGPQWGKRTAGEWRRRAGKNRRAVLDLTSSKIYVFFSIVRKRRASLHLRHVRSSKEREENAWVGDVNKVLDKELTRHLLWQFWVFCFQEKTKWKLGYCRCLSRDRSEEREANFTSLTFSGSWRPGNTSHIFLCVPFWLL